MTGMAYGEGCLPAVCVHVRAPTRVPADVHCALDGVCGFFFFSVNVTAENTSV